MLFIVIETISFFAVKFGILSIGQTPKAYARIFPEANSPETHWYTEKEPWGVWHKENSRVTLKTNCVNFKLSSNSIGARDSDFDLIKSDKSQIVLLGDSFAEGYGVEFDETAQRLIELKTKVDVLNFGSSGSLGPLQYYLLYKNLAINYPHKGLIIFFLPANDFTDNDYNFWRKNSERFIYNTKFERHRPYYLGSSTNKFNFFYPQNSLKRENWYDYSPSSNKSMLKFYKNYFWSANIFREINNLKFIYLNKSKYSQFSSYSGYYDATEEQQKAAIYFIKKIVDISPANNIYIVSIPSVNDYKKEILLGENYKKKNLIWWKSMNELKITSDKNIIFKDLMDVKVENYRKLFFKCDGHWNKLGNEWAASLVSKMILESDFRK